MAHKVFVSYHHANDQKKSNHLRDFYGENDTLIDNSLKEALDDNTPNDKILAYIRTNCLKNSTVTIVLVGSETYKRKWIDWEIYSSLRGYGKRAENGLLAIYLPDAGPTPERLKDNLKSGYAVEMNWRDISTKLSSKIEEAFKNKEKTWLINNTRPLRERNS